MFEFISQRANSVRVQTGASGPRDVVEHNRELDVLCYFAQIIQRLIQGECFVVRGNQHQNVSAGPLRCFTVSNGFSGGNCTSLSNYRDPATYMGSNFIDDHEAFVACHSDDFSGRAACNDTADAGVGRSVDDFSQYRKSDLLYSIRGYGKCRDDSVKISSHIQSEISIVFASLG